MGAGSHEITLQIRLVESVQAVYNRHIRVKVQDPVQITGQLVGGKNPVTGLPWPTLGIGQTGESVGRYIGIYNTAGLFVRYCGFNTLKIRFSQRRMGNINIKADTGVAFA